MLYNLPRFSLIVSQDLHSPNIQSGTVPSNNTARCPLNNTSFIELGTLLLTFTFLGHSVLVCVGSLHTLTTEKINVYWGQAVSFKILRQPRYRATDACVALYKDSLWPDSCPFSGHWTLCIDFVTTFAPVFLHIKVPRAILWSPCGHRLTFLNTLHQISTVLWM